MKNKKGFTLIELLAVIVILAIIALIATPIVMNVIENARKGAAERSADNYLRAVETALIAKRLDGPIEDGTYVVREDGNLYSATGYNVETGVYEGTKINVETSGNHTTTGTVSINNGEIVYSDMRNIVNQDGYVEMSADFTKRVDEETGTNYIDVVISFDQFINSGVMTITSRLNYNNEKLTPVSFDSNGVVLYAKYGVISDLTSSVSGDNNITMATGASKNQKKVGTYATVTFETDDPDSVTGDDFTYYIKAGNYTIKNVPIVQNDSSVITIINGDSSLQMIKKDVSKGYVPGDINDDGFVDAFDMAMLRKQLLNGSATCKAMDINGDGAIDLLDFVRYKKHLAKMPDSDAVYSPMTGIPGHL